VPSATAMGGEGGKPTREPKVKLESRPAVAEEETKARQQATRYVNGVEEQEKLRRLQDLAEDDRIARKLEKADRLHRQRTSQSLAVLSRLALQQAINEEQLRRIQQTASVRQSVKHEECVERNSRIALAKCMAEEERARRVKEGVSTLNGSNISTKHSNSSTNGNHDNYNNNQHVLLNGMNGIMNGGLNGGLNGGHNFVCPQNKFSPAVPPRSSQEDSPERDRKRSRTSSEPPGTPPPGPWEVTPMMSALPEAENEPTEEEHSLRRKMRKSNRERERRTQINEKFDRLGQLLRMAASRKADKFTVLTEAMTKIEALRAENDNLRKALHDSSGAPKESISGARIELSESMAVKSEPIEQKLDIPTLSVPEGMEDDDDVEEGNLNRTAVIAAITTYLSSLPPKLFRHVTKGQNDAKNCGGSKAFAVDFNELVAYALARGREINEAQSNEKVKPDPDLPSGSLSGEQGENSSQFANCVAAFVSQSPPNNYQYPQLQSQYGSPTFCPQPSAFLPIGTPVLALGLERMKGLCVGPMGSSIGHSRTRQSPPRPLSANGTDSNGQTQHYFPFNAVAQNASSPSSESSSSPNHAASMWRVDQMETGDQFLPSSEVPAFSQFDAKFEVNRQRAQSTPVGLHCSPQGSLDLSMGSTTLDWHSDFDMGLL
jgi:hypothetical protein